MATSQELPEWMTEDQMDELAGIIDNIIGKGEEANAPQWRIDNEVNKAAARYIAKHQPND